MKNPYFPVVQIFERILRIEAFSAEGRDAFIADLMAQDAIIRNFEVMGEAVKRVPDSVRDQSPGIPWRKIAGFRDVLIHQ